MILRLFVPALLVATLLASCGDRSSPPSTPPTTTQLPVQPPAAATTLAPAGKATGPAEFGGQRTLDQIEQLAGAIGPRVAGSQAETRAADYIASQFRADGYDVQIEPFSYSGDLFRAASVTSGGSTVDANAMSGSTGGTVTAPATFVGLADEAGIGGRSLAGKVAVSDRGTLTFQQKYDAVKAAGAVGLIVVNNVDGVFVGNIYKRAEMPVVGVTTADGAALKKAAESGAAVSITAPASEQSTAKNVVARPAQGAKCDILVGGHYDTVPGTPGALDNASGAAATLELARAFAADGLDAGLCFAAFSAEESGLFGSAALVKQMQDSGQLPRYMVNLDMAGLGARVDLFGSGELTAQAAGLAARMGIAAAPAELGLTFGSDHQSFQKAGVPVIFFASNELGKLHTPGDVVSDIQVDSLERVGDLAFAYIGELLKTIARG